MRRLWVLSSSIGSLIAICSVSSAQVTVPTVPVLVRNAATNPVPTTVQGTTVVAGTVAVSSLPPINLSGVPTVAIAPGAAVTITGTPSVSFSNTNSTPLFVQPARSVRTSGCAIPPLSPPLNPPPANSCDLSSFGQLATSPGQVFVAEMITGLIRVNAGTRPPLVNYQGHFLAPPQLVSSPGFPAPDTYVVSQQVRIYTVVNGPALITIDGDLDMLVGGGAAQFSIDGYVETLQQ